MGPDQSCEISQLFFLFQMNPSRIEIVKSLLLTLKLNAVVSYIDLS